MLWREFISEVTYFMQTSFFQVYTDIIIQTVPRYKNNNNKKGRQGKNAHIKQNQTHK